MPELQRLEITVPAEQEDMLSAVLAMNVPYGWQEDVLATGEIKAIVHAEHAVFMAELEQAVTSALPDALLARSSVPHTDWTVAWREFFTPVEAGSRFLVLAPWMEKERAATTRTPIIIEPKTAFGTGHHATTALCLEAVSDLADQGRIRSGMRFLDLGTGSGILGIACVTLGLTGLGLDIDILAVENSLENAALNNVAATGDNPAFAVSRGSIDDAPGDFDLVLANILAQPLKDLAPAIMKRVKPGGCLVLSGILGIQADGVAAVYTALGLPVPARVDRGEWTALVWS